MLSFLAVDGKMFTQEERTNRTVCLRRGGKWIGAWRREVQILLVDEANLSKWLQMCIRFIAFPPSGNIV